jgi:hypothetical protein
MSFWFSGWIIIKGVIMSDLNLLPSSAKFQAERIHLKTMITNFLWVFGGIWLLLVVFVFLFEFILNLNLKNLNAKYKKVASVYESLSENMALNQKIKYQAKVVARVLADRFEYGESMKLVEELFSSNVTVENLEVNGSKNFKVVGGVADGRFLDEVEDVVEEINSGSVDVFKSAEIKNISVDMVKGWKFEVKVELR